jgi:HK97 family phage portal protein
VSLFRRAAIEQRSNSSMTTIPGPTNVQTSNAGQRVTTDSAMRLAPVWAAVNLLTDISAGISYHAYKQTPDGKLARVDDPALLTDPSNEPSLTAADWRSQIVRSALLRGNGYGLVKKINEYGEPTQVQVIHPDFVSIRVNGMLGPFDFYVIGVKHDLFPLGDLVHMPAYTFPGSPIGLSPIEYARQSVGLGLAAGEFGARWFGDGAHPSAVLHSDQVLTQQQAKDAKDRFTDAVKGRREVAVLGAGLAFQPIQVSPNESQFLETIKANASDVARFFGLGMAPEMIGADSGSSMTYVNVEQRSLNLLTYAGRPWINRLETFLSSLLRSDVIVKGDIDELLRLDAKTRVDLQVARLRNGTHCVDEVRAEDNLPPLPNGAGQNYLWPPYAIKEESTIPGNDNVPPVDPPAGTTPNNI